MSNLFGKRWQVPERVTLTGEYYAMLTQDERNVFDEFIIEHPYFVRFREITIDKAALECVLCGGDLERENAYRSLLKEYYVLCDQLRQVSKTWYENLVAQDAEKSATA